MKQSSCQYHVQHWLVPLLRLQLDWIGLDRRAGTSTSSSITKFSRRVGVPSSSARVCHSMLSYCNELIDLILCRRICYYFVFVFSVLRIVFLLYIGAWFGNQFKLFIGDPLGV